LCKKFHVSSRVHNFIENWAEAMVGSAKECLASTKKQRANRLGKARENYISAMEDGETSAELGKRKFKIEKQERKLKYTREKPNVFVFGKEIYENQPDATNKELHSKWKESFQLARHPLFGAPGSADESGGNSTYHIYFEGIQPAWKIVLGCVEWYDKYKFKVWHAGKVFGHFYQTEQEGIQLSTILDANNAKFKTKTRRKKGNKHRSKILDGRAPLRVFFMRKGNNWNIYVGFPSVHAPRVKESINRKVEGVVGIDYNNGHIEATAITIVSNKLVKKGYKKIEYNVAATNAERDFKLYKDIREIVSWANKLGYTIVMEHLDFEPAKATLNKGGLRKVLHSMPYKRVRNKFERECYMKGVHIRFINPKHTSTLGNLIATMYPEMSRDTAASVVIGLRGFKAGNRYLTNLCIKAKNLKRLRLNHKGRFGQHVVMAGCSGDNGGRNDTSSSQAICRKDYSQYSAYGIQLDVGDSIKNISKAVSKAYTKYELKKRTNCKRELVCRADKDGCVIITLSGLPKSECLEPARKAGRVSTKRLQCSTLSI